MRTSNKKKKRKKEGWRNERPTFVPSSLCLSGIKVTATTAMPQVINRLSARGSNNFYPENQWLFSGRKRVTKLSSSLLFFFLYLLFFFGYRFQSNYAFYISLIFRFGSFASNENIVQRIAKHAVFFSLEKFESMKSIITSFFQINPRQLDREVANYIDQIIVDNHFNRTKQLHSKFSSFRVAINSTSLLKLGKFINLFRCIILDIDRIQIEISGRTPLKVIHIYSINNSYLSCVAQERSSMCFEAS